MSRTWILAVTVLALAAPAFAQTGAGGTDRPALRSRAAELTEKYADAVVTVKIALKQKIVVQGQQMGGDDQQVEVTGTVIDPAGLVVVSDSELDPSSLMMDLMMGSAGMQFDIETEVGEVKIVMKDGKEVPARVVLRDKDLDLAFVHPIEKGQKFTHVPMQKGAAPQILDDLLIVGRLGRNLDRTPTVTHATVRAIVKKPRTFFVPSDPLGALTGGLGCPVFPGGGQATGICLMRRGPKTQGGGSGLSAMIGQMVPVIVPAEDVAEMAAQALAEAAKAPAEGEGATLPAREKKDEPKPPAGGGGGGPKPAEPR